MTNCTDQAERERAFHDAHYARVVHPSTLVDFLTHHRPVFELPYWASGHPGAVWADAAQLALRLANPRSDWIGVRVLDAGCGAGHLALWLAAKGADVDAFDLSSVGTKVGAEAAVRYGLAARCRIRQADASRLPYPDRAFDVVLGLGVLHHFVKYPASAGELRRVLSPGGRAIFQESWWENPVLVALRRRFTQFENDAGDAPLTLRTLREWSGDRFAIRTHHLSLLYALKRAVPHGREGRRWTAAIWLMLRAAQIADRLLLAVPGLRRMSAEAVVELVAQ